MLDFFLVWGHIPGTNIDLTFTELLIIIPLIGLAYYLWRWHRLLVRKWLMVASLSLLFIFYFLLTKLARLSGLFSRRLPV